MRLFFICRHDDEIVALAAGDKTGSRVHVFDLGSRTFTRKVELSGQARGARAITWHAGRFHVVCGVGDEMRFATLDDRFRPSSSVEVGPEHRIDAGSICFGEHRFWAGSRTGSQLLVTDALFAPWALVSLDVAHGIEALPAGLFLVGETEQRSADRFTGRAYVAEPSLSGALQRRVE